MKFSPQLIDNRTVCELLQLSRCEVWRMTRSGRIPQPVSIGRRKLWRRADIEKWVADGCPQADSPTRNN